MDPEKQLYRLILLAALILILALTIAHWVNGDLSRRWLTEKDYNEQLREKHSSEHHVP